MSDNEKTSLVEESAESSAATDSVIEESSKIPAETTEQNSSVGEPAQETEATTIETLTEIMLDSAEAANAAAESANESSSIIIDSVTSFNETVNFIQKKQNIIFWVFSAFVIVSISVGAVMLERLVQSTLQADEIMLTVGKRVIAMDFELKKINQMRSDVEQLKGDNKKLTNEVSEAIRIMRGYEETARQREDAGLVRANDVLDQARSRIDLKFSEMARSIEKLEESLNRNVIKTASLSDQVDELSNLVKDYNDLELMKKLDALITLEQNRYFQNSQ
jgi:hypothetical protein